MNILKTALVLLPFAALAWDNLDYGIPGACDQIVEREGYALGYSGRYGQPLWVSYRLTADEVTNRVVKHSGHFYYDPEIKKGSVMPNEYANTSYARGHLAPVADMRFSTNVMYQSFSMANVSPQWPGFNVGVWKRLETAVRELAVANGSVFVVTGPVFAPTETNAVWMGRVRVPEGFFKVVFVEKSPQRMLGFVVPNEVSPRPLKKFAMSVDNVERATGLDFFHSLPHEVQENLESRNETL